MDPEQLIAMLTGGMDPMALGSTMANNPEAIAMQMAAQGVPPPVMNPSGMPETDAFSANTPLAMPRPPEGPTQAYASAAGELPTEAIPMNAQPTQAMVNPLDVSNMGPQVPGRTVGMPQPAGGGRRPVAGPALPQPTAGSLPTLGEDGGYGTPAPVPMPQPRPVIAQGGGFQPILSGAGAPREGTPGAQAQGNKTQDLLKAMQGIKAPPPPEAQRVSTPAAMRPNQLPANNNLVQLLAAAMGNSPDIKPVLLGQLLGGTRGR